MTGSSTTPWAPASALDKGLQCPVPVAFSTVALAVQRARLVGWRCSSPPIPRRRQPARPPSGPIRPLLPKLDGTTLHCRSADAPGANQRMTNGTGSFQDLYSYSVPTPAKRGLEPTCTAQHLRPTSASHASALAPCRFFTGLCIAARYCPLLCQQPGLTPPGRSLPSHGALMMLNRRPSPTAAV